MLRIAFVIPWFGHELKGGAEQQAWQVATRLAARGHQVEALATCCSSFMNDWSKDSLPAGQSVEDGVTVYRFPVKARNRPAFDELNLRLLSTPRESLRPGLSPVPDADARIWTEENINSPALERHLETHGADYDAVIFIPYLYGPTLRGLPLVSSRSWMQPCLHDECYAYLPDVSWAFHSARGLLFNSAGEQALAARLFGPAVWSKGYVTGEGVEFSLLEAHRGADLPACLEARRFVLFLGRRDPGKGITLLLQAFRDMRERNPGSDLALVLAGPGQHDYGDPGNGIFDLGLVSEQHRVALLHNCLALALPSPNESFSRVLYEAWYACKPAIVRRSCEATRIAVASCQGGWAAEDVDEWSASLADIATGALDGDQLSKQGMAGMRYARDQADWDRVIDRYEAILASPPGDISRLVAAAGLRRKSSHAPAIHQLAPNLSFGDAISNEMLAIRHMLRSAGYTSDIIVRYVDTRLAHEVRVLGDDVLRPCEGLIYHHSIGSEVTAAAIAHPGPKALLYHNITPAEFFRPYRPDFVPLLRRGREDMWNLASAFRASAGDSRFNADELERFGFREPEVLPLPLDGATWDVPPSPAWMEWLGDGRINILFVGRISPNKRQDRLVEAFSLLRHWIDARLIIAGWSAPDDDFARHVRHRVAELGLEPHVIFAGHCSHADLHALFRSAHVFWSFSEHEGFCVPLIEAMWFDVPVVALSSSAVPETLGDAGLRFYWGDSDARAAALVRRVLEDPQLRAQVVDRQRLRRQAFESRRVVFDLARLVERLTTARETNIDA